MTNSQKFPLNAQYSCQAKVWASLIWLLLSRKAPGSPYCQDHEEEDDLVELSEGGRRSGNRVRSNTSKESSDGHCHHYAVQLPQSQALANVILCVVTIPCAVFCSVTMHQCYEAWQPPSNYWEPSVLPPTSPPPPSSPSLPPLPQDTEDLTRFSVPQIAFVSFVRFPFPLVQLFLL